LLGVALNLANSLPDVEEDAAGGAHTLAVALGVRRSFLLCQLLILLSAMLIAALALLNIVPARPLMLIITLILTALSILAMQLFSGPARPVETRKSFFYLFVLTCIVLTGGWLIGVFV